MPEEKITASRPDGETNRKIIISQIIIVNQWGGSTPVPGTDGDVVIIIIVLKVVLLFFGK